MNFRKRFLTLGIILGFVVTLWLPATSSAETLRLVTNWPKNTYLIEQTLKWVDEFNKSAAAKAAGVNIVHVGGPEVTPAIEQQTAVRKGVFDMLHGAAGYYVGQVPEGYVFYGTDITPMEARATGGMALLNEIWGKKANLHILGWVAAGVGYHVWLSKKPKLKADGTPDLSGLKIRSSGLYRAWLTSLGATNVMIPAPDIYSALERKLVDGAAWPGLGIRDFGFEKFIKYRLDPMVWQFDNLLTVNLDKWKSLSKAARDALQASVIKYEKEVYAYYETLVDDDREAVAKAGVKSFSLRGDAAKKYISNAQSITWAQIKKNAPENYDALRAKFPPSK